MAQNRNKKIRELRKRGKDRLVKVNDQLNALAWDLSERNTALRDENVASATHILDQALQQVQSAAALLNSVSIEEEAQEEAEAIAKPAAKSRAAAPKPVTASKAPPVATLKS